MLNKIQRGLECQMLFIEEQLKRSRMRAYRVAEEHNFFAGTRFGGRWFRFGECRSCRIKLIEQSDSVFFHLRIYTALVVRYLWSKQQHKPVEE